MKEHVTISLSKYHDYEKQAEEIKHLAGLMSEKKVIKVFGHFNGSKYLSYDEGISKALDAQELEHSIALRRQDYKIDELKEQNKNAVKSFKIGLGVILVATISLLSWITNN